MATPEQRLALLEDALKGMDRQLRAFAELVQQSNGTCGSASSLPDVNSPREALADLMAMSALLRSRRAVRAPEDCDRRT